MIKVEKLSYGFPQKELYNDISFTLEEDRHCAFIGTNGTGKSTLVDMIRNPEEYLYDGKIKIAPNCKIGYVSQFSHLEDLRDVTVFEYLSEFFVKLQENIDRICKEMEAATDLDDLFIEYQDALDASQSVDGDNYESNIRKKLKLANLDKKEELSVAKLSGGEYKLIQVMKEMLLSPDLLIMDEPDGFLDFENLNALRDLINSHKGTMLVITHNRYLLNHCFDKILHLENMDIQEFDGNYIEYNFSLLQKKIELQELAAADTAEIERNQKLVDRFRAEATKVDSATRGRSLHARVSLLERLEARRIKEPFVEVKEPEIAFHCEKEIDKEQIILKAKDLHLQFDELLLGDVDFEIHSGDKVAIVGPNGTGKTTLLREIYQGKREEIVIAPDTKIAFLSQLQGEMLNEAHSVEEEFEEIGFDDCKEVKDYLEKYCIYEDMLDNRISELSGGEKNMLQLAKIGKMDADLLLLDEPTSHLDTYSQIALEKAIQNYDGTIVMVSHDFYTVANCMDYVLYVEEKTLRKISIRKFRKMIYANHFDKDYLELEQKKKEAELKVESALKKKDFELAEKLCDELAEIVAKI